MTDTSERALPSTFSLGVAARIWCDQDMSHIVMDADAAKEIATIIDRVIDSKHNPEGESP